MDALRKLGSMGRKKDNKEAVESSPKKEIVKEEPPPIREKIVDEAQAEAREESHSGLTPIRAPISDDVEVEEDDGDASFGSGESFDSALERMAASSIAGVEPRSPVGSYVELSQLEKAPRGLVSGQQGGEVKSEEGEVREGEGGEEKRFDESNENDESDLVEDGDEEEGEEEDEEEEGEVSPRSSAEEEESSSVGAEKEVSTVSVRAMPVAKLTTEDEEQGEDDMEEEDGVEDVMGNSSDENEFEEATDEGVEGLEEEEDTAPVAIGGADEGILPRIIARESRDDHLDEPEAIAPSKELTQELEKLSTHAEEESDAPAVSMEKDPAPVAPEEAGEVTVKKEGESVRTEAVKNEEPKLAASIAPEESGEVTGEEDLSRSADPVAGDETGNLPVEQKSSDVAELVAPAKQEVRTRAASSDLVRELEKLSATRTQSVSNSPASREEEPEAVATIAPEGSGIAEQEEEFTPAEPGAASKEEVEIPAPSADLVQELENLSASRSQSVSAEGTSLKEEESDDAAVVTPESSGEVAAEKAEESSLAPSNASQELGEVSMEKEHGSVLAAPDALEAFDKLPKLGEPAEGEDVFEDSHEVQDAEEEPAVEAHSERNRDINLSGNAGESTTQEASAEATKDVVAEKEEEETGFARKELPKEVTEDPAVVPSPAKLYTALKAVDAEIPAVKFETTEVGETAEVEAKAQSTATEESLAEPQAENGESDADVEDEDDDENDDEDDDEDDEGEEDMDTNKALAELANAVGKSGADSGNKPSLGAAGPSLPQRPTVRKASGTALEPAGRTTQRANGAAATQLATTTEENTNGDGSDGNDETREKLQNIRVKFLRLAHRLGQSPQNVVVAQVLYRLGLAEQLRGGRTASRAGAFSFDRASALAEEQEATNQDEELDFACTILLLGKTGVGKSATINSIFDERKSGTSAYSPSTKKVQEIVGSVHGIKVRVIDTPGLLPCVSDQQHNERIMGSVKKYIRKSSPDIVLYFDRLDMQSRDYGDLPLLRTITDLFGAAVWFNAIVVLTHASSAPPDGPNGVPLSYEMFVAQRSHVVQQTIRQAAGDMRLMNPVSLVENHPACRTNRTGQRVLPNGQLWKPQLLLLCFASKILAEANSLLKLQDTATPGRPFGQRPRVPPLPFLLSSLLQSRAQLKMPDEQMGDEDESEEESDEDDSDGDDYDELPPFRPLSKEELEELSKEQKQQYTEELADREKLFQKKQYREELRRRKEMKKRAAAMSKEELSQPADEAEDEAGRAAAVPVPMPDMALPPSFDSDNPTHRYRYLETANQWLVRPVLETHGWDHDAGYDGFNVEKMFVVMDKIPASVSGQVTKDKKEAQVNFEAAASLKHGEGKVTLTGFDVQTIGKDLAYTLRAETQFNNFKRNKTTGGLTFTLLGDTIAAGLKLEDRLIIGKRLKMVVNGGVMTGKGDKAFGGSLEATLRGKEYPLSRTLTTLGLSVMDWHGDLAIGGNLQSQFMVGKTMMVARGNLNNRGAGQISLRASSSEQLQMVLIGIIPILRSLINSRFGLAQPSQ